MKKINDQGMIMYVVTLKNNTKTRFWFMNEGIIEELLNDYEIPYKKILPHEKYEWNNKECSEYWKKLK